MKFTCERSVLLKEISIAQEIISSKNAISILSNVLLEAENDTLLIKATDIKVNFETRVPITLLESGATTVFCDKLLGILTSIPDGELEFDQSDIKITIKPTFKKIKFQLKSIASEKFPEFPSVGEVPYFELPSKEFKEMITQTVFAVSDDETRYFMNGVFLEKNNDKLTMVATDGRRLAFISKEAAAAIPDFNGVIVPPKVLSLILKRAGDEGMIGIAVSEKNIFIKFGSYHVSSVLIEGHFPNYQRVIPEKQLYSFGVNKVELTEALKRVSLLVEQKSRRIYLNVNPGFVAISSEESEIGTAREEIPCRYDGESVTIALNYRYLEEPLKVIAESEVTLHFSEANKAITMYPEPTRDFFHIIMPMQLD
jgi:DNA polymerase-3 subunit beta